MAFISSLFPIIATLLLLLAGISLFLLHLFQPNFRYSWLVASNATLIAWMLILFARTALPITIPLGTWSAAILYTGSPVLSLDGFSWPITIGLVTLGLAVILTDVVRSHEEGWSSWASSLVLISIGMIAAMASGQVTLMLAWGAIDLFELLLWMIHVNSSAIRERVVLFFSLRAVGLMLILLGGASNNILILAVILRLGVIPFHLPGMEASTIRRGLGTIVRLVPAISCIGLLVRIAMVGLPNQFGSYVLIFTLASATYSGFQWLLAKNELDGRPFWILGLSFLSIASAVRGQPVACLAYGLGMLFEGGVLFLYSVRNRLLTFLIFIAIIASTSLPFTPSWDSARLYAAPLTSWMLAFFIPQALLLAGYIRHSLHPSDSFRDNQRVEWLIYSWGLSLLLIVHIVISFWNWPTLLENGTGYVYPLTRNPVETWAGVGAILLTLVAFVTGRFFKIKLRLPYLEKPRMSITSVLYKLAIWLFRMLSNFVNALTSVVEGEAGILWTLLLLVLLLAFFAQGGLGG